MTGRTGGCHLVRDRGFPCFTGVWEMGGGVCVCKGGGGGGGVEPPPVVVPLLQPRTPVEC